MAVAHVDRSGWPATVDVAFINVSAGPLKIGGEVTLGIRTYFGPKFVKVGWVRTYFDPSGTHVGRGRPNIFGPGSRHPGTDYVLPFRDALQRFVGMVR
jgi:hypothetical protein